MDSKQAGIKQHRDEQIALLNALKYFCLNPPKKMTSTLTLKEFLDNGGIDKMMGRT